MTKLVLGKISMAKLTMSKLEMVRLTMSKINMVKLTMNKKYGQVNQGINILWLNQPWLG